MTHVAHLSVYFFEPVIVSEIFKLFFEPVLVFVFFKRALLFEMFPKLCILLEVLLGPAPLLNPMIDWKTAVIDVALHRLV